MVDIPCDGVAPDLKTDPGLVRVNWLLGGQVELPSAEFAETLHQFGGILLGELASFVGQAV